MALGVLILLAVLYAGGVTWIIVARRRLGVRIPDSWTVAFILGGLTYMLLIGLAAAECLK